MKTERDVFDLWFKKNFYDLHEAICCGDLVAKNYKKAMFKAWQARVPEGYVVVPVEPSEDMIMAGCMEHGGYDVIDSKSIYKAMIKAVEK